MEGGDHTPKVIPSGSLLTVQNTSHLMLNYIHSFRKADMLYNDDLKQLRGLFQYAAMMSPTTEQTPGNMQNCPM